MPSIIPYNSNLMTSGGSWNFSSGDTPYPLPPSAYDSPLDYTGYIGDFVYTYTITCGEVTDVSLHALTITNHIPVYNDECSGAELWKVHNVLSAGSTSLTNQYFNANTQTCPGLDAATLSSDLPSIWNNEPVADIWFKIPMPESTGATSKITVTIDGTSYSNGLRPYLALYTGGCGTLSLQDATAVTSNLTSLVYNMTPYNTNAYLYVRLGAEYAGYYNVTVESEVLTASTPASTPVTISISGSSTYNIPQGRLLDIINFEGGGTFKVSAVSPGAGDLVDDTPSGIGTYDIDYYANTNTVIYLTGTGTVKLYIR